VSTREEFIGEIRRALRREGSVPEPAPFIWRHTVHTDAMKGSSREELVRAFVDASRAVDADVFETGKDALNETIVRALERCGAGGVIVADDPVLRALDTVSSFPETRAARIWDCTASREDNVRFAESAAAGIAVAEMALAESATVLLFSREGCGRLLMLLPESTITVIPASRIRPRLTQAMAFLDEHRDQLPSSVNFVSGPSATSDIELVRVVGVHGPVHVVHIVVTDM
jgi:L-lactate dehydrogenase complex protein LldG